jgi:hypothetical protein
MTRARAAVQAARKSPSAPSPAEVQQRLDAMQKK